MKQVVSTLRFNYPVDTKDLERRVSLKLVPVDEHGRKGGEKSIKFTVSYDKYKGEAYVASEALGIPPQDSPFTVRVDAGIHAERGGPAFKSVLSQDVSVPGMFTYFKILPVTAEFVRNEKFEPESVLIVNTSVDVSQTELDKNITVYLLPVDRPASPGIKESKNYSWYNPDDVQADVLKASEKVKLDAIPTENEFSSLHSYKYVAPARRHLYVQIKQGTKAFGDYLLAKDFQQILTIPHFPKELKIMHEGSLLSMSGQKKISIAARGMRNIRFKVGRLLADQVNHLVTQSSGDIGKPNFNSTFNEENLVERFTEERNLASEGEGKSQYTSFDFSSYLSKGKAKHGLFFLKVEKWDPENKQARSPADQRFILVTDLGILLKSNADGSRTLFVQSIHTGDPVGGATVEVLGKNGLAVVSTTTSGDGMAKIPSLKNFTEEKMPSAFVVKKGNDLSFLPYERYNRELNYSRFEVGGDYEEATPGRLKAYLFSDRGIYRPGDEFHMGIIVRDATWTGKLAGVPVEAVISDPRGVEIYKKRISLSTLGYEEVAFATEDTSPTGAYNVSLYVIKDKQRKSMLGSTSVRVEEFQPDRMKITAHLSTEREIGWIHPKDLKLRVNLMTLFGIPAAKRKVVGDLWLNPTYPYFSQYKQFHFFDPMQTDKTFTESLGTVETDDKGEVQFDLGLEKFAKATYQLKVTAEGFEAEGGRGVIAASSAIVSPLSYLVGYKEDGKLNYIQKDSERNLAIIAISPEMKLLDVPNLKAQIYEIRHVSSLVKQSDGTYRYQSVKKEQLVSDTPFVIAAKENSWKISTDKPGDFALVIRDADDTKLSRAEYSVVGDANLARNLEKNAELQIKLDKSDYSPGEEIELQIIAPYEGSGLITIERDEVYAHKWFKTKTTSSVQTIKVPSGLEGNAFVNVSFIRSADSEEIFMSPLSYAVAPFTLSRNRRINKTELVVTEKAKPGETLKIKYTSAKRGKIVIIAVDEGILQVAKYATPDPLASFFRRKALSVHTFQILDQILPEFDIVQKLMSTGGGEGGELGKNLNPFKRKRDKPVAFWSGLITTDRTSREVKYEIPDYFNGTLRVFAIAVAADSIGVDVKKTNVKGPFVISPNVPLFVAPGDEFQVTAAVANNVEGSGANSMEDVTLETSKHFEIIEGATQKIKIAENKEETAKFKLKAKDSLGSGTFTFRVSAGTKAAKSTTDTSIRPAIQFSTKLTSGNLKKNSVDLPVTRKMFQNFRKTDLAVSFVPLGMSRGLMHFLDDYPYGCTEQMVSKAFPALLLHKFPEFGYTPKKVEERLNQTIRVLRIRQTDDGAFGYWAANSNTVPFLTVYAAHFLTEAKQMGYAVPPELLENALGNLHSIASGDYSTLSNRRDAAYAIYVLTRNSALTTNYINSIKETVSAEKGDQAKAWKTDLGSAFIAASYQLMQNRNAAWNLIKDLKFSDNVATDYEHFYDGLVRNAGLLYLMAKHFPDRFSNVSPDDVLKVMEPIRNGTYNTLSSSFSVMALSAYSDAVNTTVPADVNQSASLTETLENGKSQPLTFPAGKFPRVEYSELAKSLKLASKETLPLFYSQTEAGFDLNAPKEEIKEKVEILREIQDGSGKPASEVELGRELEVHLKVRSLGSDNIPLIAAVDLLPGGFEVVLDSVRPILQPVTNATPTGAGSDTSGAGEGDDNVGHDENMPADDEESPQGEGEGEGEGEGAANHFMKSRVKLAGFGLSSSLFPTPAFAAGLPNWPLDYIDVREDRVVLFGRVPVQAQEFVYRIKATNVGRYTLPPAYAESMYDRTVFSRTKGGGMIEVKPAAQK
jgi:uncharacterized protein YfaS (alpha-2-macroglobulin family)